MLLGCHSATESSVTAKCNSCKGDRKIEYVLDTALASWESEWQMTNALPWWQGITTHNGRKTQAVHLSLEGSSSSRGMKKLEIAKREMSGASYPARSYLSWPMAAIHGLWM